MKKSDGADDFETRKRLLSDSKVVGEPGLGGWMSCALRGAERILASQLKEQSVRKCESTSQATQAQQSGADDEEGTCLKIGDEQRQIASAKSQNSAGVTSGR